MAVHCETCGRFCRFVPVHEADYTVPHCFTCDGPTACYVRENPYPILWKPCPVCGEDVAYYRGEVGYAVGIGHSSPKPEGEGVVRMTLFPSASASTTEPGAWVSCVGGWTTEVPIEISPPLVDLPPDVRF
jgi:hypothetical protein